MVELKLALMAIARRVIHPVINRHLAKVMDTATPDYRDQRSSAFSIRIAAVEYDNALTRYERFSVSE